MKYRPSSRGDDNNTVCLQLFQIVLDANSKHICEFENDAAGTWERLCLTHQDQTAGEQVYWLQKLVLMRMDPGSDINEHTNCVHKIYERVNALVTPEDPLTSDDTYVTALVISIPENWASSKKGLLLKPLNSSRTIIAALKHQSTYCKARIENDFSEVSALKAKASNKASSNPEELLKGQAFRTFCRWHGHDLLVCKNAKEILSKGRREHGTSKREKVSSVRLSEKSSSKTKSNKAAFVEFSSSNEDSRSEVVEAHSVSFHPSIFKQSEDNNIDLGCGKSMTPHSHHLTDPVTKRGPVWLADDSIIKSTHVGAVSLPASGSSLLQMLLVSDLLTSKSLSFLSPNYVMMVRRSASPRMDVLSLTMPLSISPLLENVPELVENGVTSFTRQAR